MSDVDENQQPVNHGDAPTILSRLFEPLPISQLAGQYDAESQTWSHRDARGFSPVKLGKEM